jgi:RimJ/RimL family protein N-acetyltransferase
MPQMSNKDAWYELPVMRGELVRLEPLSLDHTDGYFAAAGTGKDAEEVFRWVSSPMASLDDAHEQIRLALEERSRGERFPFAQIDPHTGEVMGTTSYYDINPALQTLAIGSTWLGRRWWRTGANTEAKLLLLRHAFDELGAVRVVWHTDIYNERSQAAITRLGATREGVLRKHRLRRDGTWRDTVQYSLIDNDWPAVDRRLTRILADHQTKTAAISVVDG